MKIVYQLYVKECEEIFYLQYRILIKNLVSRFSHLNLVYQRGEASYYHMCDNPLTSRDQMKADSFSDQSIKHTGILTANKFII